MPQPRIARGRLPSNHKHAERRWESFGARPTSVPFKPEDQYLADRIRLYAALNRFDFLQTVAKHMAHRHPDEPQWTVYWADATRRVDSIEAARRILVEAVTRLPDIPTFHYNLSCYDCQLGELDAAKVRLERAFELDVGLRSVALDDEDLRPLWRFVRGGFPDADANNIPSAVDGNVCPQ